MEFAYKMTPAFRHGAMTPWGGSALKTLYGKDIPDDRTGESLEASTLPGLESRAADGRTLTEVLPLDFAGRIDEIARINGGELITAATRAAAEDQLRQAHADKSAASRPV